MDIHFTEQDLKDLEELAYDSNQKWFPSQNEDIQFFRRVEIGCLIFCGIPSILLLLLEDYMGLICFLIALFMILLSRILQFLFLSKTRKGFAKIFAVITEGIQYAESRSDGIYVKRNDDCICSFSNIHHIVFYKNMYFLFLHGMPFFFPLPKNDRHTDEIKAFFKNYPQIQFEEKTSPFSLLDYVSMKEVIAEVSVQKNSP